jgi:glutathione S-transferase
MHAGFGALRNRCPLNVEASLPEVGARIWVEHADVRADVKRIESMWAEALADSGGPFLFGAFSAADAYYAPVCMRFRGYALPLLDGTLAYIERVVSAPGVAAWIADARAEQDFLDFEEPYRKHR